MEAEIREKNAKKSKNGKKMLGRHNHNL